MNLLSLAMTQVASSGVTWLIGPEGFEGTGAPSGAYSTFGTVNFDSTASPLAGAQSCVVSGSGGGLDVSFASTAEVWVRTRLRIASPYDVILESISVYNGTTPLASLEPAGGIGEWRLRCGSVTTTGTGLTGGADLRVWLRYVKGTGSNAIAQLYISTTDTMPGSPTGSITTGTSTLDADNYWCASNSSVSVTIDDTGVATSNPGNF